MHIYNIYMYIYIYLYIYIYIYIYIYPLHTHDYLNSKTKFETLVWRLMKGPARN